MSLQAALVKDPSVSVNRVIWSPDGSLFGVAYSRYIAQIYSYHGSDDVRPHFEIDAHVGGVNIQFIFSTALDGKIKAWLYDNMGSRVDYEAPGRWCTTMT